VENIILIAAGAYAIDEQCFDTSRALRSARLIASNQGPDGPRRAVAETRDVDLEERVDCGFGAGVCPVGVIAAEDQKADVSAATSPAASRTTGRERR
jgi:hypothetical protein